MKKIKFFTALLAVALVACVTIFYACKKDNEIVNNLNEETGFIAKNYDGTCVQVYVFRDENNNVKFVTKDVATDPNVGIRFIISDLLNIQPQQTRDTESEVYEIPNDAIYWLVPFDGNEPVKFEPIGNTKQGVGGSVTLKCDCYESINGSFKCSPQQGICVKGNGCTLCRSYSSVSLCNSSEIIFLGTTYLVQSDSITIDGVTYE